MISEAEIRRFAARWSMDPMIVDLDYAVGCFLSTLYRYMEADLLRFKGGTCLRKCYFADYRFSEDLDFTATQRVSRKALENLIRGVLNEAVNDWGIDFNARPFKVEIVDDEYGKESYHARLYYRGPLRRTGDPRAIRLDITTNELLVFNAVKRNIIHPYTDRASMVDTLASCYDLLETLAEKIRALAGQRRYAISRDIYDIDQLVMRHVIDLEKLAASLSNKLHFKGLKNTEIGTERLESRRDEYAQDWSRNLVYLLPSEATSDFEKVWSRVVAFLSEIALKITASN